MLGAGLLKAQLLTLSIFVTTLLCSCTESSDPRPRSSLTPPAKRLPSIATGADCPEGDQGSIDPLIWAHSFDAIVVGDVVDVSPLLEPAWVSSSLAEPTFVSAESCAGSIAIGIIVRLANLEYLAGSGPSEIELDFGNRVVGQWEPAPSLRGNAVYWPTNLGATSAVSIGQRFGALALYDPRLQRYSSAGAPAFLVDSASVVRFQSGFDDCSGAPPHLLFDNQTLPTVRADLAVALDSIQAEGAAKLHEAYLLWPDDVRLANWHAALCIESYPSGNPSNGCVTDAECEPGFVCAERTCTAR